MRIFAGNRSATGRGRAGHAARAQAGTAGAGARAAQTEARSSALVVTAVEPVAHLDTNRFARLYRPNAGLIAQLVALRDNMHQQRARRRAEPTEAINAYRTVERQPRTPQQGRVLSVSR